MLAPECSYTEAERATLLNVARESIEQGLKSGRSLPVRLHDYSEALQRCQASFVTLEKSGQLRGCIGTLEAYRSLVEDVAEHAYAAAFRDPRFPPVSPQELPLLDIHISVLTPASPLTFTSERDLLAQLVPGRDGLILQYPGHRATFLPSVWETLPGPGDFLNHLKAKAGLPIDFWSDQLTFQRYTTIAIP
ncbi:MAG: AmmeMemoRadiSam system protein A [Hahellaceae bacterium]|nr:AmmeMemoRadiSam system protein A [Hahellaceae bacterium]